MLNFKPEFTDRQALRAEAAASVGYTPTPLDVAAYMDADALQSHAAEDMAHLAYCELTLEDKRELIGVGDTVRYTYPGYLFEGEVTELCEATDRAKVRFEDQFGVRYFWCSRDLLELKLKAAALKVGDGVAG